MADPKVERTSETWRSVVAEIERLIAVKRKTRDDPTADLRKLDYNLGGIKALEYLANLADRQEEKPPEPIKQTRIGVPGIKLHPTK